MAASENESYVVLKNTDFSYKEEVTENTAPTDAAGDAVLLTQDDLAVNLPRELIELNWMQGTLSKDVPLAGIFEDLGFNASCYLRGSGTQGSAPDWAILMKHVMGDVFAGTNDAVEAAPAPTTTAFEVSTGSNFKQGGINRIEVTAGNFEFGRVLSVATDLLSYWPPFSAAPGAGLAAQSGYNFLLKSGVSDFKTGSAYFYMDGTKKLVLSGCRGRAAQIALEVGQPAKLTFDMAALSYAHSYAAQGYTPTYNRTTKPPIVLGIQHDIIYHGTQALTSAVGSVLVSSSDGNAPLEVAVGDLIIIDTDGAGAYETQTILSVTNSGSDPVTLTHGNFSAVNVGSTALIVRSNPNCMRSMEININMELIDVECASSTTGKATRLQADRTVEVNFEEHFKSFYNLDQRDNVVYSNVRTILGSTAGNIIAIDIPRFYISEIEYDFGNQLVMQSLTGSGRQESSGGNDEIFISSL